MAYKKVTGFEKFRENPFVEKAVEDIKIVKKTQVVRARDRGEIQMIVSDAGVVEGYTQFLRFIEVEEAQFAKVYLSQFSAFWELSKPAIRVFGYIINILKPKSDSFILRMEPCLAYTRYKHRKDVMTGISSLIESGIIARSEYSDEYFINPLVVFNGDRVTFAKTYIKKKVQKEAVINSKLPDQLDVETKESE
jgi:hypothetical protein